MTKDTSKTKSENIELKSYKKHSELGEINHGFTTLEHENQQPGTSQEITRQHTPLKEGTATYYAANDLDINIKHPLRITKGPSLIDISKTVLYTTIGFSNIKQALKEWLLPDFQSFKPTAEIAKSNAKIEMMLHLQEILENSKEEEKSKKFIRILLPNKKKAPIGIYIDMNAGSGLATCELLENPYSSNPYTGTEQFLIVGAINYLRKIYSHKLTRVRVKINKAFEKDLETICPQLNLKLERDNQDKMHHSKKCN